MPEKSAREVMEEWRAVLDAAIASASSVAGRAELPREMLRGMQRQAELLQQGLERERGLAEWLFTPLDAVFDLLEESGATLRRQAESLEAAGRGLAEAAALMKGQAELFERTITTLRAPADRARAATGLPRRPNKRQPASRPSSSRPAAGRPTTSAKPRGGTGRSKRDGKS